MAPHSEVGGRNSTATTSARNARVGHRLGRDSNGVFQGLLGGLPGLLHGHMTHGDEADRQQASKTWWFSQECPRPSPGNSHLCLRLWKAWVIGVIAGAVLLLDAPILVYVGFITAAFVLTAVIPDSGDSPAPFFVHLAVPFFVVKGVTEGGWWTCLAFVWAFGFIPLADYIVGVDISNKSDDEYKVLRDRTSFRFATWVFLPAQLALLSYACYVVNTVHLTPLEYTGFVLSIGVYTGGLGITVSHELVHKTDRLEQWLGRVVCVVMSYGHFFVEHNRGHHKKVATDADPATARFGESFYVFLPRCIVGSFVDAWRLEVDRCRDRNLPFWHNEMLWYWAASACLCGLLAEAFGPKSVPLFLSQSLFSIVMFESVNYVEHYGLERCLQEDGKPEPVGYEHSWDAPFRLTNMVLFNLQKHGDHHVNSTRRYQTLRAEPSRSPQLPLGYPACVLMALVPPLWMSVMDKRVLRLRGEHRGRKWRHGPGS